MLILQDVGYVSLANVLYRSGYYENAATAMQLALEVIITFIS